MMDNIELCPICKSGKNTTKWTTDSNRGIDSYECSKCDIVFADKMLSNENYRDFYDGYNKSRPGKTNQEKIELKELRKICYNNDMDLIDKNCNMSFEKILDVGCGTGKFLSLFDSKKERVGFDIDRDIIIENRKIYQDIKFVYDLKELGDKIKFDMIVFRGTLQYMRDLNHMKKLIDERLNNGGYLVILSLPNKNSPLAVIQREDWSLYNPIEMFNIFSIKSIANLFENYSIVETEFPYIDSPYSNEHEDLMKFVDVVKFNKKIKFPFWGSMINIIFKKGKV